MSAKEATPISINKTPHIVIVAPDNGRITDLLAELADRVSARLTLVDTINDARMAIKALNPEIVIADHRLEDGYGMDLVPRDGAKHYQVILLKETLEMDRVLLALRLGVADIFVHPIDGYLVVDAVERLCKRERVRRRDTLRQSRLRGLSSKLIKDRRVLRQRVDLICNDIVHAYRHLAEKVVGSPDWTPPVEEERPTRERY